MWIGLNLWGTIVTEIFKQFFNLKIFLHYKNELSNTYRCSILDFSVHNCSVPYLFLIAFNFVNKLLKNWGTAFQNLQFENLLKLIYKNVSLLFNLQAHTDLMIYCYYTSAAMFPLLWVFTGLYAGKLICNLFSSTNFILFLLFSNQQKYF